MLVMSVRLEKEEMLEKTTAKLNKSSVLGHLQKQQKGKKLFTHPSLLISPLKHSTNETHCWKELCKEIN